MSLNVETSKDGYKILKIKDGSKTRYLGSRYNQEREIKKFLKGFGEFFEDDIYIIFGLSFCEHIIELLKLTNSNKILVVEKNDALIKYCMDDKELKKYTKKINIANNIDDIEEFFENNISELDISDIKIAFYCGYEKIYENEVNELIEKIKNETTRLVINRNTKVWFGERWFELLLDNLKYMINGTPVNALENKYKNIPAIIVSAGPSLDKNIDELRNIENSLIISGGRTLKALVDKNINPDYLCVYDSGDISYELVKDYISNIQCPLIFHDGTNYDVVKNHKYQKIFSTNNRFISQLFDMNIQGLSAGGSVSHVMTMFAIYMGCNPIIFIGQDLAYSNGELHAECTVNKLDSDSTKDDYILVDGVEGKKVKTSVVLNRFRLSMEEIIKDNKQIKFINATEGGANIKGAENKKLSEVIDKFSKTKKIHNLGFKKELNVDLKFKMREIYNNLRKYISMYKELEFIKSKEELEEKMDSLIESLTILDPLVFIINNDLKENRQLKVSTLDSKDEVLRKNHQKKYIRYLKISLYIEKYISQFEKIIENI